MSLLQFFLTKNIHPMAFLGKTHGTYRAQARFKKLEWPTTWTRQLGSLYWGLHKLYIDRDNSTELGTHWSVIGFSCCHHSWKTTILKLAIHGIKKNKNEKRERVGKRKIEWGEESDGREDTLRGGEFER